MSAAEKGYADMVQVLLQNGANPKLANNQGDSALTIALMKGYPAFLKGWPESDRRY